MKLQSIVCIIIFRFDEFPRDLRDVISILEQDIRKRSKYLVNRVYDIVVQTASDTAKKTVFYSHISVAKCVLYLIHLEVCYNNLV